MDALRVWRGGTWRGERCGGMHGGDIRIVFIIRELEL